MASIEERIRALGRPNTTEMWPDIRQNNGKTNLNELERRASLIGGGVLSLYGLVRRSPIGLLGGYLVYRGATGECPVYEKLGINTATLGKGTDIKVEKAMTIDKPAEELYRFWRNFENLPKFMEHLESVTVSGEKRSHWIATAPLGAKVEWDAEITEERENELISWRSLPGADVPNAGTVRFSKATGNRGTEVHVTLEYSPPAGKIGTVFAKLSGEAPEQQVQEELRHFKQLMEAGEIPTTKGQPSCRNS